MLGQEGLGLFLAMSLIVLKKFFGSWFMFNLIKKQQNKADQAGTAAKNGAEVPSKKLKSAEEDTKHCVICMDELENGEGTTVLSKCNHHFHKNCIDECFKRNPQCPCCKTFYGAPKGTQPTNGRMSHSVCNGTIPGFKCKTYIQINYSFPSGTQGVLLIILLLFLPLSAIFFSQNILRLVSQNKTTKHSDQTLT